MLKVYLRLLLEEYMQEIDWRNAISLVKEDVSDLLDEIIQEMREENALLLLTMIWGN